MTASTPTARSLLRHPFAWSLAALGGLPAATMTFSYLSGSSSRPDGSTTFPSPS